MLCSIMKYIYICSIGVVFENKERSKLFLWHECIIHFQLNIFIIQGLSLLHNYYLIYKQQDGDPLSS